MSSSSAVVRLPSGSQRAIRLSRSAIGWPSAIAVVLMAVGVVIWWLSLSDIALGQMTDLGLASVLPAGTWVSFGLITVGFGLAWWFGSDTLIVAGILATILALFGLGVLGEPTMRFATTWQHVGIADFIATHGYVNPNIDAYFNWPGFFITSAFLSKVAGLRNIEPIARAAPLFFNAMYLIPLVSIGRSLFTDRRVIWLGVWLFFVNNWIGQDYYSPQGFGFFMSLVVIAVILRWFKWTPRTTDTVGRWSSRLGMATLASLPRRLSQKAAIVADAPSTGSQRVLLIVAIIMITTTVAASHQFSPFAMVAGTAALSVIGWCRLRTLPLGILLITLTWVMYMSVIYLSGHLHSLTASLGAITSTVNSNVGGHVNGSPGHQLIVKMRLFTTALLWIVAALGFLRRARAGQLSLGLLALAISPFPLLVLQSYGGEVLLRIALFSMPFMALSAASLFVPVGNEVRIAKAALAALACFGLLLVGLFPFNRYGNERQDYFPPDELAGLQVMYRLVPNGSYIFAPDYSLPWRYEKYADYYYYNSFNNGSTQVNLDEQNPQVLARSVAAFMTPPQGARSFLIITSSANADNDLFGPFQPGADLRLGRILSSSPYFRLLYHNPDVALFELK